MFRAMFAYGLLSFFYSDIVFSASNEVVEESKLFSVALGASRIVYLQNSKGAILPVNNEHDYPMLIQTLVKQDERLGVKASAQFRAIPPLFRLDGQQRAKVRIVQTGGTVPNDRETLYWICVKGIPPAANDNWAEGKTPNSTTLNVQLMVSNCIKLLVRPNDLAGQSVLAMAEKLSWRQDANGLTARNETPFYINLSMVSVGGKKVENVRHIAPFSEYTFNVPAGTNGQVQWRALSDLGGEGPLITATAK